MREAKTKSAHIDVDIGCKCNQNREVTKNQISWRPRFLKNQHIFFREKKGSNCRRLAAYKLAASFLDPSQLFFSKG